MKLKFIGTYTGERDSITVLGCTFSGHKAREVPDDITARLANHPEFAAVKARAKKDA